MEDSVFMAHRTQKEEEKNHYSSRQRRFTSTAKMSHTNLIRFLLKNEVTKAQALYLQLKLHFLCAGETWKVKLAVLNTAWAVLAGDPAWARLHQLCLFCIAACSINISFDS